MKKREFLTMLGVGVAAASVAPQIVEPQSSFRIATSVENAKAGEYVDICSTDIFCPRTPRGIDVYSPDGTFKGIYQA